MLMVVGGYRKHFRNSQDFYAARYPDRQQKSHMAFKQLADRFCRFGTVKQTQVKRRPIVNENNAAAILAFAALNPQREQQANGKEEWNQSAICIENLASTQVPSVSYVITS